MNTQELGDKNSITHTLKNQYPNPIKAGIDDIDLTTLQINGGSFKLNVDVDSIIEKFTLDANLVLDYPNDYGQNISAPTIEEQDEIDKKLSDTKRLSFASKYKH